MQNRIMKKDLSVAVLYSMPSEHMQTTSYVAADDDTKKSAIEVCAALKKSGINAFLFPVSPQTIPSIKDIKADCIFNIIEWTGLDMPFAVKAMDLLEKTGIPFTGASKENYIMNSDKKIMKQMFDARGIPTPRWQVFETGEEEISKTLHFPVILKLCTEHCSIGLNHDAFVGKRKDLRKRVQEKIKTFKQPVLVEEYIDGKELQATVLCREGKLVVLPPAEIEFEKHGKYGFLTYESRWDENHPDYEMSWMHVTRLGKKKLRYLEDICIKLFTLLNYNDYTRVDIRMNEKGEIFVLEANSNPGLGDDPDYAMTVSCRKAHISFNSLIVGILTSCLRRYGKETPLG